MGRLRIYIEHLIRIIKIFRVAGERFRLNSRTYKQVMLVICGLVRLRIDATPHKLLSSLIANLKATSSKTMWRKFEPIVSKVYYGKKVFWTGSYFVASCGGVTIDVLKKYVQDQDSPR